MATGVAHRIAAASHHAASETMPTCRLGIAATPPSRAALLSLASAPAFTVADTRAIILSVTEPSRYAK